MKFELKSVDYWSLIKVSFLINLVIGFIFGLLAAVFIGFIVSIAANFSGMPAFQEGMPPMGLILIMYPFIFALFGAIFNTIFSIIIVFVYNMTAKLIGGIEMELSQVQIQPSAKTPSATTNTPGYYSSVTPHQMPIPPPPPPVQPLPPDINPPEDKI